MPPKVKITKEEIVKVAVDIVRRDGYASLNARSVASVLECSTQPIFSNFATMDDLRVEVEEKAEAVYCEFIDIEQKSGKYPPYKASGMAYIRFAKEEKELFKLLYMRDRSKEGIPRQSDLDVQMIDTVSTNTGLDHREASLFHLEMWAFVHGIAAMLATGFLELDCELISKMLTDCYIGLKKRHESGDL